jgi:hypothetical protein
MTSTNNTSSTPEMTTPSQTTLLFKKTLRVVREVTIDYEMDYDEFVANNMNQLDDEDDVDFTTRCLAVWEAIVDQQEKKTKLRPAYVELGEREHEEDWDDWDGDAGEECADDITELIDAENKEFPKWVAAEAAAKKRREERAAIELAEWKARQEQRKKDEAERAALYAKQDAERKAEYALWVQKQKEEKVAALRAELAALENAA